MTGRFVVYKLTNNLECGIDEEVVAIFEDEEEAYNKVEELEEEAKEFENGNVEFEVEYEYI